MVAASMGLALVAGCGMGRGSGKTAEAPRLSRAQLTSAVLDSESVAEFDFQALTRDEMRGWRDRIEAQPAECQPLADVRPLRIRPGADAFAVATGVGPETSRGAYASMFVGLGSYTGRGAEAAFERLRAAVRACGSGFSTTADPSPVPQRYTAVVERVAPKAGDAAISYELSSSLWGISRTRTVTVVRSGSTLVYFDTIPESGEKASGIPDAVVVAQLSKLRKVQRRAAS